MSATLTTSSAGFHCVASPARVSSRLRQPLYFFLDFSNIAIAATQIATLHGDRLFDSKRLRLHAENLKEFVTADRHYRRGFAAAGLNGCVDALKYNFEQSEIEFQAHERGCITGREQGIDAIIQGEMRKLLPSRVERGVVALATGDGNGHNDDRGFLPALQDLHAEGFSIEVMSWEHSFNSELWAWASSNGKAILLDPHFRQLTFVEGGRRAERVRLTRPR